MREGLGLFCRSLRGCGGEGEDAVYLEGGGGVEAAGFVAG